MPLVEDIKQVREDELEAFLVDGWEVCRDFDNGEYLVKRVALADKLKGMGFLRLNYLAPKGWSTKVTIDRLFGGRIINYIVIHDNESYSYGGSRWTFPGMPLLEWVLRGPPVFLQDELIGAGVAICDIPGEIRFWSPVESPVHGSRYS